MTQATEVMWKTNCPKICVTPYLETPKDIGTNIEAYIYDGDIAPKNRKKG